MKDIKPYNVAKEIVDLVKSVPRDQREIYYQLWNEHCENEKERE